MQPTEGKAGARREAPKTFGNTSRPQLGQPGITAGQATCKQDLGKGKAVNAKLQNNQRTSRAELDTLRRELGTNRVQQRTLHRAAPNPRGRTGQMLYAPT